MKPVEMQPQFFQQPNVVAPAGQAATGAAVTQQAFAEQLRRTAEARPTQVQAPVAGDSARPVENPGEERGERGARRRARRPAPAPRAVAGTTPDPAPAPGGSRIDVRV